MAEKIEWQLFPKSLSAPSFLRETVDAFQAVADLITSQKLGSQESNYVLAQVKPHLEALGYLVEQGKTNETKIKIPVLYGKNGSIEKSFDADALWTENRLVLEVEAGRAVTNYQFLKDLFQACVMPDIDWLVIAVRRTYRNSKDFHKVIQFMETLFVSPRMTIPLKGVLIIGY